MPTAVPLDPIQRGRPLLLTQGRPAERQPQLGAAVAAIVHELEEFTVRRETISDFKWLQKRFVARSLVVEGKHATRVPDLHDTPVKGRPPARLGIPRRSAGRRLPVGGEQRIARESVFDVCEHQLLMLLFVVDSQFDDACHFLRAVSGPVETEAMQQSRHALIDGVSILEYFGHRRPRQQSAPSAGKSFADAVVVGIEERLESGVGRPIVRLPTGQHKCLKKPGGVRQVPPRRAGVGHGLHDEILDRQGFAQVFRKPASLRVVFGEISQYSRLSVETAHDWIDNAGFRACVPFAV